MPPFRFRFAEHSGGYFKIPGRILGIDNEVWIDETRWLERKLFIAERNVSIFRRIAKVKGDSATIIVGGDATGAIPSASFDELLRRFPNSLEVDRYASARVEVVIGEFFDSLKSARDAYETYLSRRRSVVSRRPLPQVELFQAEIDKYVYLRDLIARWLEAAANYSELDWQRMIVKVILLILPKYVAVLENVEIADFYSTPGQRRRRFIDLCLVDAGGNIDVIEIKKPFDDAIVSRSLYRDNSIPTRELAGSIILGGSNISGAALRKAADVGVVGIVVGGIVDRDLIDYLGYDIGVAITGHENIPLTLVITEGSLDY